MASSFKSNCPFKPREIPDTTANLVFSSFRDPIPAESVGILYLLAASACSNPTSKVALPNRQSVLTQSIARTISELKSLVMAKKSTSMQYIEPIGARVLVRKDEPKRETKGGIALPDAAEIPTITGRIVTISRQVAHDQDMPLRQYDKILFHPKNAIPVDFEPDNQLFVIPVEDVVAVFRSEAPTEE
jgi:chaperonin GroES